MNILVMGQALILTLLLLLIGCYQFITKKFIARAIKTTAIVTTVTQGRSTYTSIYMPTISFQDQTGRTITASAIGVGSLRRNEFQIGKKIDILFDPENPDNFIIDNWHGRYVYTFKRSAVFILLLIVVCGAAIYIFS